MAKYVLSTGFSTLLKRYCKPTVFLALQISGLKLFHTGNMSEKLNHVNHANVDYESNRKQEKFNSGHVDLVHLDPPHQSNSLTSSAILCNAAKVTVESSSTLYAYAVYELLEVELLYAEALEKLLQLMQLNIQVIGNALKENQVWDALLESRSEVSSVKRKKMECEEKVASAEKTLLAAAESAFLMGAETASFRANEVINSLKIQTNLVQKKSAELEKRVCEMEVTTIEETTKQKTEELQKLKDSAD